MDALTAEANGAGAPPAGPPPVGDAGEPSKELHSVLRAVGTLVAPTSLLTSVLYYFGFVHSTAFWRYFGLDISLLGLSTQYYLIRSVQVLFVPLVVMVTVGSLILWVQAQVLARITSRLEAGRHLHWVSIALAVTGAVLFLIGLAGIFVVKGRARFDLRYPLCFGSGAVLLAYASRLRTRSLRTAPRGTAAVRSTAVVEVAGAFLLVSISLFWASTNYGAAVGRYDAEQFERVFHSDPEAVVYGKESLRLEAPGVLETSCPGPDGGFRFRYDGLRLITRSAGKYFLLPEGWTPSEGVALVVPESPSVRLQFLAPQPSGQPLVGSTGIRC